MSRGYRQVIHPMKVLVSACLLGINCKYNGGNSLSPELVRFLEEHETIPVCPEILGRRPVPRPPVEIVDGVVREKDGTHRDREFHNSRFPGENSPVTEYSRTF